MRIAIVGGHGKVARQLHPILAAAGHEPIALVRRLEYRDELQSLGAQVRILDIEGAGVDAFTAAFEGCDAVIFAAGAGPDGNIDRKRTVDLEGTLKSLQAAGSAGIRRFVQVSAIGVDEPLPDDTRPVWRAYVEAKRDSDAAVRASGLDWTIIRPGSLTDDTGTGAVSLGTKLAGGQIPRADVAAVIAAVLDNDATVGRQLDLISGPTPVAEAVAQAVAAR